MRRPVVAFLLALLAAIVVGALLGVLWWRLAPLDPLFVAGGKAYPQTFQPRDYITDEVVAAILCTLAGLVAGVAAVWITRPRRLLALWSSLAMGCLGAVALWLVGTRLGAVDMSAVLAQAADGDTFEAPLRLRMPGILVLWPLASAAVIFVVALYEWWRGRDALPPDD